MAFTTWGQNPSVTTVLSSPTPTISTFTVASAVDLIQGQYILVQVAGDFERVKIASLVGAAITLDPATLLTAPPDIPGEVRSGRELTKNSKLNQGALWTCPDLIALAATPIAGMPDGTKVTVPGWGSGRLVVGGTDPADGYFVIDANGPGQWKKEVEHLDLNYSIYPDISEMLPVVRVNPLFTSIAPGATQSKNITVPGARLNDSVFVNPAIGLQPQLRLLSAEVTSKNTVTITVRNDVEWTVFPPVVQSLNFGSINSGAEATLTVTVTGAAVGDGVSVTPPSNLNDGVIVRLAWVSATNTVSIRLRNLTGGAIDPAAGNYTVIVTPAAPAGITPTSGLWSILVVKPNALPAITIPGLRIYIDLLGGKYPNGAALETELGIGDAATDFTAMLASTRRRQALLDDAAAKAVIQASTTANAIMESYEGAGY